MPYTDIFRDRRVLVTGGLGFIGSNLALRLVELGAHVVLVDSMVPDYGGNLENIAPIRDHPRVHVNFADVRDENAMQYLVGGQDFIFNLAGQVSHIDSMRNPYTDLEINCRAQLSLLEACRKHNPGVKILYASTRQIYGKPQYLPIDEKHLLTPTDVNGINKMAGERYHIVYHDVYGIRSVALRLTNTYGPRMLVRHNRQTALGWFVKQAIDDEEIQIWGDGSQLRDYTYVDDAVEAFLLAAAHERANGGIFNLGGLRPVSHLELIRTLIAVAGTGSYRITPFPPERKVIDIGSVYSDWSHAREVLGWAPKVDLEEGLRRTIAFFRQHREHYW